MKTASNLGHIIFFLLLLICISSSQWVQQNSGVPNSLYMIQFVNRYTGWSTGSNSVILKTTNGGVNWFPQQSNLSVGKNLNGLCMLDANNGYIVGAHETMLKTTNGGTNWLVLRDGPVAQGNTYNAVSFVNYTTGWASGFMGIVIRTTNGGLNWDSLPVGSNAILNDIQFLNSQTGWVCGDVGYLRKTTNGGNTWLYQFFGTTSNFGYNSMHFINVNTGWLVSEQQNQVFRTTNSGVKWDTLAVLPGGSFLYSYCIHFSSYLTGWIGGTSHRMFKTTNSGLNWYQQVIPQLSFVSDINFYNDSIGWAVIGSNIIHTTTSGLYVGITTVNNNIHENIKLNQNIPNPFNPKTSINFEINNKENILIKVYNITGKEIITLVNQYLEPGIYTIEFDGGNYSSGIYFYSLITNEKIITKRMMLLK